MLGLIRWQTDFAVSQQNGEVLGLYNPQGELHWQASKSGLWGERLSNSADNRDPGLAFAGQLRDSETGLCYNRFRYYDPQGACYISPDPIGILGGENNYGYVPNPVNWVDPLGLAGCKPTKYHKRTVSQVAKLRKSFERSGGVREKFLKHLSKQSDAVSKWGDDAVTKMGQGKVPDNMVVHHKTPLFRGGNNKYSNLDLMDKEYHTMFNKSLHWYPDGMNPYGLN